MLARMMWPCGEMASRLTTTQCDQEIAGSTPVSVSLFVNSTLQISVHNYSSPISCPAPHFFRSHGCT